MPDSVGKKLICPNFTLFNKKSRDLLCFLTFDNKRYMVSEDGHFDSNSHIDESNRRFRTRMAKIQAAVLESCYRCETSR